MEKGTKAANHWLDTLFYGVLAAAGLLAVLLAQRIKAGAGLGRGGAFMPKVISTAWLIISGLLLLFHLLGLRNKMKAPVTEKDSETLAEAEKVSVPKSGRFSGTRGFFLTLILLTLYVAFLKPVGFVIMSAFYLFFQMLLFVPDVYRTKKNCALFALIAVVMPVVVNLLFVNVFSLILPRGIL